MRPIASLTLKAAFPLLLPPAIRWAQRASEAAAQSGMALTATEQAIARRVGVREPERIRLAIVDEMPRPGHPALKLAARAAGFLGPDTMGLTLGHAVLVRRGCESARLLSHEFRHVFQYEEAGSIADFLRVYFRQVLDAGYEYAPLEVDARRHEIRD